MAQSTPPGPDQTRADPQQFKQDAGNARDTVTRDFEDIGQQAQQDLGEFTHYAQEEFDRARHAAGEFAEKRKSDAAEALSGLASALDRAADDMREGDQKWAGDYARRFAGSLDGLAERARTSSIQDIVADVERFGRRSPGLFLGAAAMLGFAASRVLMASPPPAPRDSYRRHEGDGAGSYTAENRSPNGNMGAKSS